MKDNSYAAVMARKDEILSRAAGIDYRQLERSAVGFDYQQLMSQPGKKIQEIRNIQTDTGVGGTPLLELRNLTELVRRRAQNGKGARIFIKDESTNPSGSFKDRRASLSAYHAKHTGYEGLVAATSGNYGAAVASQAARHGLRCIIIQEALDSSGRGQPEILEKTRKCEALGAEVLQTSVGPELFYLLLCTLEETGFFNASLYTPYSVAGIETLGVEIVEQVRETCRRDPDLVLATHAGGGMVTGTTRGLHAAGSRATTVVGVSVDLQGLHMASDRDFNRKSFTTGHTGFSIPFTTWPDRVDVPRNAARPLRYLDRFVVVTQGEVFFATELLARIEGLERGPAGNTSLAAAVVLARDLDQDQVIVVTETEYTGAGKNPTAQLAFAQEMGINVKAGRPAENQPGRVIAIPRSIDELQVVDVDLDRLRASYLARVRQEADVCTPEDLAFLSEETGLPVDRIEEAMNRHA